MSQGSEFAHRIFGKGKAGFVCVDVEGEYAAIGTIVLLLGRMISLRANDQKIERKREASAPALSHCVVSIATHSNRHGLLVKREENSLSISPRRRQT